MTDAGKQPVEMKERRKSCCSRKTCGFIGICEFKNKNTVDLPEICHKNSSSNDIRICLICLARGGAVSEVFKCGFFLFW